MSDDASAILSRAKAVVNQSQSGPTDNTDQWNCIAQNGSRRWEESKREQQQQQREIEVNNETEAKLTIDDLSETKIGGRQGLVTMMELGGSSSQVLHRTSSSACLGEYESLINELFGSGMDPVVIQAARSSADEDDEGDENDSDRKFHRQCDVLESLVVERELCLRSYLNSVEKRARIDSVGREQALVGRRQAEDHLRDERIASSRRLFDLEHEHGVEALRHEKELNVLRKSLRKADLGQQQLQGGQEHNADSNTKNVLGLDTHEKILIMSAVVNTVETLRGRLVRCTVQALGELVRIANDVHKARDTNKVFKEAHLELKTVLVTHFGDRKCRCGRRFKFAHMPAEWPVRDEDIFGLARFEQNSMTSALKRLVVAFDNSSAAQRMSSGSFRTYLEILRNRKWIFAIAELAPPHLSSTGQQSDDARGSRLHQQQQQQQPRLSRRELF